MLLDKEAAKIIVLRATHWTESALSEGHWTRFLLAYPPKRCGRNCQNLQSMPKQLNSPIQAFGTNPAHTTNMAIAEMGMDLVGPPPPLQGGNKFAVVAVEYFTRWIGARPLAIITSHIVKKLFWQNIVCRFRVPRILTVDNGKQFNSDNFKEFCKSIGTSIAFALVYHLESNGAVGRANRIIFSTISKTLFSLRKGKWVDELPHVVWSHNITTFRATCYTPFRLLYGEEAMLPEEAKVQSRIEANPSPRGVSHLKKDMYSFPHRGTPSRGEVFDEARPM
jgi:hypothetical protein